MRGLFFAIGAAISATLMSRIVHVKAATLSVYEAAFIRNIGMAIVILPWVYRELPRLFHREAHPLWTRGVIGVVGVLLFFTLVQMAPVSDALFLSNMTPITTLVLAALLLKERPTGAQAVGMGLILSALLIRTAPAVNPIAITTVLFAGVVSVVQAFAYISIKRSVGRFPPLLVVFSFCLATIIVIPFFSPRWGVMLEAFSQRDIWLLILFGLGTQVFMTKSFETLSTGQATLLGQTSIFFAGAIEVLLGERVLHWSDALSVTVLFIGLAYVGNLFQFPRIPKGAYLLSGRTNKFRQTDPESR